MTSPSIGTRVKNFLGPHGVCEVSNQFGLIPFGVRVRVDYQTRETISLA